MTSANINITTVKVAVAIKYPASPYRRTAIAVASEAAAILTRLLPINIRPIKRSVHQAVVMLYVRPDDHSV